MSLRNETLRRIAYAMAMLTGVVLVGTQFGCIRSSTFLHTPGFPHAGRWAESLEAPAAQVGGPLSDASSSLVAPLYWTSPRPAPGRSSRAISRNSTTEGSTSPRALDVAGLSVSITDAPPFSADTERSE